MARRGVAGIVMVWLLASGLGLACGRLNAQERAALVARGQQLFADKGCYGCHTDRRRRDPHRAGSPQRGGPVPGSDTRAVASGPGRPRADSPHARISS